MEDLPMVSVNEIVGFLNDILEDVSFAKTDFTSPTPERIQTLYFKILLEFGFSDKIIQPIVDQLGPLGAGIQNLELLQDTDHLDTLMVACRYFFAQVYPSLRVTFGLMDLIEPEPKRTRQFVSGIRNFYFLCNQEHPKAIQEVEDVHNSKAKMIGMRSEVHNARNRIEKLRINDGEDAMRAKALENEIWESERQLATVTEKSGELTTEQENLKSQLSEIHHIIDQLSKSLGDLEQSKLLIVSRLKSDDVKKELGLELENLKEKLDNRALQEQEMKRKLAEHEEKNGDIATLFSHVDGIAEKNDKVKTLRGDFKNQQRALGTTQQELEGPISSVQTVMQMIKDFFHLQTSMKAKWKKKKEQMEAELHGLKSEYDTSCKGLGEEELKKNEYNHKLASLHEESSEIEREISREKDFVLNEYAKLLEAIKAYNQKFVQDMEEARKYLKSG